MTHRRSDRQPLADVIIRVSGQVIRRLRRRAGISQERLAAEAGVDRTHVGNVERRGVSVGIATMHAFLCALGVTWAAIDAELANQSPRTREPT
jgi:transcriptional regulator with XRE-family HTH domain